jgi:hypothetical protein
MIRPSTHPAEQYRRARTALAEQLATVIALLGHLDPDDTDLALDELVDFLTDAAYALVVLQEDNDDGIPTRPIANVDTGGRL